MVHGFEQCGRRVPIKPGHAVVFEFLLDSEFLRERLADARFDESVRYRFAIDLYDGSDLKRLLGSGDRCSNYFSIVK